MNKRGNFKTLPSVIPVIHMHRTRLLKNTGKCFRPDGVPIYTPNVSGKAKIHPSFQKSPTGKNISEPNLPF